MSVFGNYTTICQEAAYVACPMVGAAFGVEPACYSRNVEVANTVIFQPATCFIEIIAIIMTGIMIYHIRSKYTAVGRKEIVMFFYLYLVLTILNICLDSGIIPTASPTYPYFAAIQIGLVSATFWCLLANGFVGFQFAEDGTPLSLWSIRLSSLVVFLAVFAVAICTFLGKGLNPLQPTVLWIFQFIFNLAAVVIYVVLSVVLVVNTLDDRWPLGDICIGCFFFTAGQILLLAYSVKICDAVKHYIDGLFFGVICNLLAVMMVYKFWDDITKEDLEFSVGSKANVWEVKELLSDHDDGFSTGPSGGYGQSKSSGYGRYDTKYDDRY